MGWVWNFLLLFVHYIPLLMLINIQLLKKTFSGGGGGGINLSLGFRGFLPLIEILVCVDSTVLLLLLLLLAEVARVLKGALSRKCQSSVYSPYHKS